jgi:guanosine-3',5'-bis(diphosphate) 3'-pyrophosphohydrolase
VANVITDLKLDTASCAPRSCTTWSRTRSPPRGHRARVRQDEIAFLVDGVTKLSKFNFTSKEDRQAESFRKMLVHMAKDIRVLLVKLATASTTCARSST